MEDWGNVNLTNSSNLNTFKMREQEFNQFMENYLQVKSQEAAQEKHSIIKEDSEKLMFAREQLSFLNIFGARIWFDLHKSKDFLDYLREKIKKKLLKVKIAQYFEEVHVTTLDLGQRLPQILSATSPWQMIVDFG